MFSLTSMMVIDESAEIYLQPVDLRDKGEFIPFVWFDSHKSDEFKHFIPLSFNSGETKYIRMVVEPAPMSWDGGADDPFEMRVKVVSNTTGFSTERVVEFSVAKTFDPCVALSDRMRVPGIGFYGLVAVLIVGTFVYLRHQRK